MKDKKLKELRVADMVYYAGSIYKSAGLKDFPHGKMIGIYDEPPSDHIDYLSPDSVSLVYPCYACQGGGCPVCSGQGEIIS